MPTRRWGTLAAELPSRWATRLARLLVARVLAMGLFGPGRCACPCWRKLPGVAMVAVALVADALAIGFHKYRQREGKATDGTGCGWLLSARPLTSAATPRVG